MDAFGQHMKECRQEGTLCFHQSFHQAVLNLIGCMEGLDWLVLMREIMDQDKLLQAAIETSVGLVLSA
eukprot:5475091-Ditylum_brightwellii.AAC.1